jgi:hypothetical protein
MVIINVYVIFVLGRVISLVVATIIIDCFLGTVTRVVAVGKHNLTIDPMADRILIILAINSNLNILEVEQIVAIHNIGGDITEDTVVMGTGLALM